jgi:hypothetical protein
LILDTHAEVFVWVGWSVDSKEKQNTFEIGQVLLLYCLCFCHFPPFIMYSRVGMFLSSFFCSFQKYIEVATSLEGLSPQVPLYKVTEGNEPCFFTTYFQWDHTKAVVCVERQISLF